MKACRACFSFVHAENVKRIIFKKCVINGFEVQIFQRQNYYVDVRLDRWLGVEGGVVALSEIVICPQPMNPHYKLGNHFRLVGQTFYIRRAANVR